MYRIYIQNGYVVSKETMHHLPPEKIAELEGIFVDDAIIEGKRLPAKPIYDGENIVDIQELPDIQYSIDKATITTLETATITISDPATVIAIIDEQEYLISDGAIEYSNENIGQHSITMKAEGYRDTIITVEVVEV